MAWDAGPLLTDRRLFFEQHNQRHASLRADGDVWADVEAERAAESGVISDESM